MHPPSSYTIYCSTPSVHSDLLATSSSVLKRASDVSSLRLETSSTSAAPASGLDIPRLHALLRTSALGHVAVYTPSSPSTQDVLRTTFRTLPAATVAIAETQTAARGRRGSQWSSPAGAAAFSMLLHLPMAAPERLTFVQYVAALAGVESAAALGVRLRIKWPNDLYLWNDKVGGVLCEASTSGTHFEVVVGVGVNVCNEAPTACLGTGSVEEFLAEYFAAFEALFLEFSKQSGFGGLLERYLDAWMHSGQKVRLEAFGGRMAVVEGLAPNGHVRVRCEDNGETIDMAPDVTSLDVVAGVMREKVVGTRVAPSVGATQGRT